MWRVLWEKWEWVENGCPCLPGVQHTVGTLRTRYHMEPNNVSMACQAGEILLHSMQSQSKDFIVFLKHHLF